MNIPMQVMSPEEMEARHAAVSDANAINERARVARINRAKGYPEPQPGDHLYVTSGRGIKYRGRAGHIFSELEPTTIVVIGELDERPAGVKSVTVSGAEEILHDGALNVRGRNASDAEFQRQRDELASKDREIAELRAENARIMREARMGAKDAGDGSPARLNAARKAKTDTDGFGSDK